MPGRHVTARFYIDAEEFLAEHCFYVLASHANYIPGKSLTKCFLNAAAHSSTIVRSADICMCAMMILRKMKQATMHTSVHHEQCLLRLELRCTIAWHWIVLLQSLDAQ